ncbi:undecaprenyl-diphosphatase [Saccharothrix ecbatanensis]|uniref:Undecaprenyl-diphosphatase n=1 Tax=Saccharothrix ecbatanensis TaxID=1105145 RepID=A0A7W9M0A3_9PSEU|nr:phosphatase PAP2 family protein [Saccharothrix ecbatanensis]MBB5802661.1 undecaprenyl-diphosphatase [Saccharothrix ecbatanensis]
MNELMAAQAVSEPAYPASVSDVPDVSAWWYLEVVERAAGSAGFTQSFAAFATEALIVVFAVLFAVVWWRARPGSPARRRAYLAPVVTVLAYLVSEGVKEVWQEDRPCRALGEVTTIVPCPEVGDWSFPSNHSAIAGAAAVAVLWSSRALGALAVATALLTAASRVFVGVHYPHDVVAGLLLGASVAALLLALLMRLTTRLIPPGSGGPRRTRHSTARQPATERTSPV